MAKLMKPQSQGFFFTRIKQWCTNVSFLYLKELVIYLAVLRLSCGIWDLVPWPGIKPGCPTLGVWSLSHWTTREVPVLFLRDKWEWELMSRSCNDLGNACFSTFFWYMPNVMAKTQQLATGLEKVSFHSNPKERQCQRMFQLLHNCIHLTR